MILRRQRCRPPDAAQLRVGLAPAEDPRGGAAVGMRRAFGASTIIRIQEEKNIFWDVSYSRFYLAPTALMRLTTRCRDILWLLGIVTVIITMFYGPLYMHCTLDFDELSVVQLYTVP